MKQNRRVITLVLSIVLLCTLFLPGCREATMELPPVAAIDLGGIALNDLVIPETVNTYTVGSIQNLNDKREQFIRYFWEDTSDIYTNEWAIGDLVYPYQVEEDEAIGTDHFSIFYTSEARQDVSNLEFITGNYKQLPQTEFWDPGRTKYSPMLSNPEFDKDLTFASREEISGTVKSFLQDFGYVYSQNVYVKAISELQEYPGEPSYLAATQEYIDGLPLLNVQVSTTGTYTPSISPSAEFVFREGSDGRAALAYCHLPREYLPGEVISTGTPVSPMEALESIGSVFTADMEPTLLNAELGYVTTHSLREGQIFPAYVFTVTTFTEFVDEYDTFYHSFIVDAITGECLTKTNEVGFASGSAYYAQ